MRAAAIDITLRCFTYSPGGYKDIEEKQQPSNKRKNQNCDKDNVWPNTCLIKNGITPNAPRNIIAAYII